MTALCETISVSEMLAKINPKLSVESIPYGNHQFQAFIWHKQIWLRATQVSIVLNQRKSYCQGWRVRYPKKFTDKTFRVCRINSLVPYEKGRYRKQKTSIFSLQGIITLMNIIGTPESIRFGEWAAYAIDQYDYLIDEKKPT